MTQRGDGGFFGEICTWQGISGRRYRFSVYALGAPTLELDGVFILATEGGLFAAYRALLVGDCANLARDLMGSAPFRAAVAAGASSVHLYYSNLTNPDRRTMKRDLVERYRPRLNFQATAWSQAETPAGHPSVVIPFPAANRSRKRSA